MSEKKYISPKEAAKMLNVSPITVRHWANQGLLKIKMTAGGHRRFDIDVIERFIKERAQRANEKVCVLIIDDDRQLCSYIKELLEKWAERAFYTVEIETAMSGLQAGASVDKMKPDLIFLDLMLPQVSGYQICQDLQREEAASGRKIIAMTGYFNKANEEHIKLLGATCCLAKPIDKDQFYTVLEEALPSRAVAAG